MRPDNIINWLLKDGENVEEALARAYAYLDEHEQRVRAKEAKMDPVEFAKIIESIGKQRLFLKRVEKNRYKQQEIPGV